MLSGESAGVLSEIAIFSVKFILFIPSGHEQIEIQQIIHEYCDQGSSLDQPQT